MMMNDDDDDDDTYINGDEGNGDGNGPPAMIMTIAMMESWITISNCITAVSCKAFCHNTTNTQLIYLGQTYNLQKFLAFGIDWFYF